MKMYTPRRCSGMGCGDFAISTLFWGFLIFIALVVCCLLVGKAIGKLRNDVEAEEQRKREEFLMAQREWDEFLLVHGTEMERRASKARINQRRQAEQARQNQCKT